MRYGPARSYHLDTPTIGINHERHLLPRKGALAQTAKLFTNGRSQAVRLPAAFRFDVKEMFIRQDPETDDAIQSRKPVDWAGFLAALKDADIPADFLGPTDREHGAQTRDPLAGLAD